MLIEPHSLTWSAFDLLASGRSDPECLAVLREAQFSKHLLLLREVVTTARAGFPDECAEIGLDTGYKLLIEVQEHHPETFREVVSAPSIGAWAACALRRMRTHGPVWADLAHLGSIAAAAAIRCGLDFTVLVPTRSGEVALPTLGAAQLGSPHGWGLAPADGSVRVQRELRRLTTSGGISVHVDDIDPYRDVHGLSATGRLDEQAMAEWQAVFTEAWVTLAQRHPARAEEIGSCVVSLVPLASRGLAKGVSATSRDAFGAVALTTPESGLALAVTLIHEAQHAKLDALLDLVDLYDRADGTRYYSPWRADPRPLSGLLQGSYAFLAVADFWREQPTSLGEFEFARITEQLRRAMDTLQGAAALTEDGRRFAEGMRAELDRWGTPEEPAIAREAVDDHRIIWRLRNLTVDTGPATTIARSWLAGEPGRTDAPAISSPTRPSTDALDTTQLRLVDRMRLDPPTTEPPELAGFLSLARGDYSRAARFFRERVADDPDDLEPWAGLALARRRTVPLWSERPELVYAVHRRIRELSQHVPDPDALAAWLAR